MILSFVHHPQVDNFYFSFCEFLLLKPKLYIDYIKVEIKPYVCITTLIENLVKNYKTQILSL